MSLTTAELAQKIQSLWPEAAKYPDAATVLQGLLIWSRVVANNGSPEGHETHNFAGIPAVDEDGVTCAGYSEEQQLSDRCVRVYATDKLGMNAWKEATELPSDPPILAALRSGSVNVLAHALAWNGFNRLLSPSNGTIAALANRLATASGQVAASLGQPNLWTRKLPVPPPPDRNPEPNLPPVHPFDLSSAAQMHSEEAKYLLAGGIVAASLLFALYKRRMT